MTTSTKERLLQRKHAEAIYAQRLKEQVVTAAEPDSTKPPTQPAGGVDPKAIYAKWNGTKKRDRRAPPRQSAADQ
jgi:hypothetical protein